MRRTRRFVAAAALAWSACIIGAPVARADGPTSDGDCGSASAAAPYICVTVTSGPDSVAQDAEFLPARCSDDCDVENASYDVHFRGKRDDSSVTVTGRSLAELIDTEHLSSAAFVTVDHPGRLPATAEGGELDPPDGQLRPVVYGEGSSVSYVRAQRKGPPEDFNADDVLVTTTYLHVDIHTMGTVLHPTVSDRGTNFVAAVTTDDPRYFWYLGSALQPGSTGPSFPRPDIDCTTTLSVVVTDGQDTSYGQSESIPVGSGPRCTGSTGTDPIEPSSGPPTTAVSHHSPTRAAMPSPTRPATSTGRGSGAGAEAPGPSTGSGRAPVGTGPRAVETPVSTRTATAGGVLVSGLLLDPQAAGGGAGGAGGAAAGPLAAMDVAPAGGGLDARWLWLLAPVALLSIGALVERRRP